MSRRVVFLAGLALLVVAAMSVAATGTVRAPQVHVVVIDKMVFGPMPAEVRAGDVIEWVNHGVLEHTATARDGSFDVDLKPGASARTTARSGTFAVFCKFHPTMQATLVVR